MQGGLLDQDRPFLGSLFKVLVPKVAIETTMVPQQHQSDWVSIPPLVEMKCLIGE